MANTIVEIKQAKKNYGQVHAVKGVDLCIEQGEMFGLIGHNGAGKSTLFKMMLGLIPVSSGDIRINGVPVHGNQFRAVRRNIGYLPENVVLYDNLTGLETLRFFAKLKNAPLKDCTRVLERVGLSHAIHRRVREYSKGMRQRLGFAQALLDNPKILFLDEPTNGLDPEAIREFYAILRELKSEGVTLIITSHILAEIQERVDRLAIMASGTIAAEGTVQSLREKLDLPLWFNIHINDEDFDEVQKVLQGLPIVSVDKKDHHIEIQCRRDSKMLVLETLATLDGKVKDLHLHEPSLEDVFFGFAD